MKRLRDKVNENMKENELKRRDREVNKKEKQSYSK